MISRMFRGIGIDGGNDILLSHVVSVFIIDDLNKFSAFFGGILLIVYTCLGIIEKYKKLKRNESNDDDKES